MAFLSSSRSPIRRPSRRAAAAVTVTAALVALAGCDTAGQTLLEFSDTEAVKITEVRLGPGGNGDIAVRTADIAEVRIRRVVRYRGTQPGRTYRIDGTVLHADSGCGQVCSVDYDIEAPAGVRVSGRRSAGDVTLTNPGDADVRVGSGEIRISGGTGDVAAQTGSGDIFAADLHGTVTLKTGSGGITGERLGGGQIRADTGSGDLRIGLDRVGPLRANTASGGLDVVVPKGSYRVRADTGSGDERIGVTDDPNGQHLLELNTGSGDLSVTAR